MTDFQGFDSYSDPGDDCLADAKAQGFSWVAPYLVAPSHSDDSWRDYPSLIKNGLNLLPLWVGAQIVGPGSHDVGQAQGAAEAQDCLAKMKALLYPSYIGVAFDTEEGHPISEARTQHLQAWADGISAGGRKPMVYGSYQNFDALAAIFGPDSVWVYMLRDSPPEYQGCACQWQQNVPITLAGKSITIDRNVSHSASPAGAAPVITVSGNATQPLPGNMTQPGPVLAGNITYYPPVQPPISTIPPAPVTPQGPSTAAKTVQAAPTIGAGLIAAATAALGAVHVASSNVVDFSGVINAAWPFLIVGVVMPLVVWGLGRAAQLMHLNTQSTAAQIVVRAVEAEVKALSAQGLTYADQHATVAVQSPAAARVLNYVNTVVPARLAQSGITPDQLAALVTNRLAQTGQPQ